MITQNAGNLRINHFMFQNHTLLTLGLVFLTVTFFIQRRFHGGSQLIHMSRINLSAGKKARDPNYFGIIESEKSKYSKE